MGARVAVAVGGFACSAAAVTAVVATRVIGWGFEQSLNAFVVSNLVIGVGFALCGGVIAWHRGDHPVGWLYLVGGTCQTASAAAAPLAQAAVDHAFPQWLAQALVTVFAWGWPIHIGVCLPLSLYLLPDGRVASPRWRWWFVAAAASAPLFLVEVGTAPQGLGPLPDGFWTLPVTDGWRVLWTASEVRWVVVAAVGVVSLGVRYRRGDATTRRQLLWILAAALTVLLAVTPWALVSGTPIVVLFAIPLIPAAIAVAILRHALFDIRLVFARGLAYVLLSLVVLAGYAILVLALSGVVSALVVSLLAFPLRSWFQTAVERLLYGDRGDLSKVMAQVGGALPDLSAGLEAIRESLRLPYVAVWQDDGTVLGEAGSPAYARTDLSLGDGVSLAVGLRSGERRLSGADARALDLIAGPLKVAVTATTVSRELQASRERIVSARAEERRRLLRDLHDGLGPLLTGVALAADAAANVQASAPEEASALIGTVRTDIRSAVHEVHRLVDELRPQALGGLGLAAALEVRAARTRSRVDGGPVAVALSCEEFRDLPAAIEVAAYRIVTEALTNVVRHSNATHVRVRVARHAGDLVVEVADDGTSGRWGPGVGTMSMRERAEELGGTLIAGPGPDGGIVKARLPVARA